MNTLNHVPVKFAHMNGYCKAYDIYLATDGHFNVDVQATHHLFKTTVCYSTIQVPLGLQGDQVNKKVFFSYQKTSST